MVANHRSSLLSQAIANDCKPPQTPMRKQFPFEKLEVWQDARRLVHDVYACSREFPKEERFGLTSQLTRAAVSVVNNLAEGSGRSSLKDQAHFSNQAYGSLMETACDLILVTDLKFTELTVTDPILITPTILACEFTISANPNSVGQKNLAETIANHR